MSYRIKEEIEEHSEDCFTVIYPIPRVECVCVWREEWVGCFRVRCILSLEWDGCVGGVGKQKIILAVVWLWVTGATD